MTIEKMLKYNLNSASLPHVKMLLQMNPDLNNKEIFDESPLLLAVRSGNLNIVQAILNYDPPEEDRGKKLYLTPQIQSRAVTLSIRVVIFSMN